MTHPSLSDALAEYRRYQLRKNRSNSAVKHGRYQAVAVARYVAPKHFLDVDEHDLTDYLDHLRVADTTRATYTAHIKSFYRWLKRKGYIPINPAADLDRPVLGRRVPRPINDDDLDDAMETVLYDEPDPRMVAWLALMGYQGARCIEVPRCRGENFRIFRRPADDGSVGTVILWGKGNKERTMPLTAEAWKAIQDYYRWIAEVYAPTQCGGLWRPSPDVPKRGPLFKRFHGRPKVVEVKLTTGVVTHRLEHKGYCQVAVGAGYVSTAVAQVLPGHWTAHTIRHWFGTNMYKATDGDLLVVQELMGHADPATTAGYAQTDTSKAGPAMAKLSFGRRRQARLRIVG